MNKPVLKLVKNELSQEERMQHRIDALKRDLWNEEGSMDHLESIFGVIYEYMSQFEDEDVIMSAINVKEATFYIANFNNS